MRTEGQLPGVLDDLMLIGSCREVTGAAGVWCRCRARLCQNAAVRGDKNCQSSTCLSRQTQVSLEVEAFKMQQ